MPEWMNLNLIALAMLALFLATGPLQWAWSKGVAWITAMLTGGGQIDQPVANIAPDEHALYTAFLAIRKATATDPQATTALDRLVLPALISGATDPNYHVCWEGAEPSPPHRDVAGPAAGGQP